MQAVVTLTSHVSRSVNTRNGQRVVHTFKTLQGMELQCWNTDVANQMYAYFQQGLPVNVDYEAKQNGQYTNYDVKSVTPSAARPVAGAVGAPPPSTDTAAPPAVTAPTNTQGEDQRKKEIRIMRQVASKVAVQIAGWFDEADRTFENVVVTSERLLRYYAGGPSAVLPESASPPSAEPVGAPAPSTEAPAPTSSSDDDIPV